MVKGFAMQAKLEQEYKNKIDNAKSISDQLEQFKLNYIKKLKEDMLEGELIKRQAEEDLEREKQRELARQKRALEMKRLVGVGHLCCKVGVRISSLCR